MSAEFTKGYRQGLAHGNIMGGVAGMSVFAVADPRWAGAMFAACAVVGMQLLRAEMSR